MNKGGIALTQGAGQYNMEIDGHSYLSIENLSTLSLAKKMESIPDNKSGVKISLDMTNKGKYITTVHPPKGRNVRIATSDKKPSKSAVFTVQNKKDLYGTSVPAITGAAVDEIKSKGIPSTAKKIKQVNPKIEQLRKWEADFKKLYEKSSPITYSTLINLDGDEALEAFFCTKIPSGPNCFVVDVFEKQERYYITGFNRKADEPIHLFSTESGTYISHQQKTAKVSISKVLRFDGSGYIAERL
jgi:translation initiation factor 1 (eIF-1/SUI1)